MPTLPAMSCAIRFREARSCLRLREDKTVVIAERRTEIRTTHGPRPFRAFAARAARELAEVAQDYEDDDRPHD
jgi:hypothetical protein